MVNFYAALCSLLLLLVNSNLLATENDLKLTIMQKTVQLGKPIWVTINTRQQSPSLQGLDFSTLQQQFEVVKDHNEIHQTNKGQQWRIRLYPRIQGALTIPPLTFNQTNSTAVHVQVTAPIDSKTGQTFDVEYRLSNTRPWIKQQVLVTYTFTHSEPRLVLKPLATTDTDMKLIPLSTSTEKFAGIFKHISGWAIYPQKSGKHSIKLPALHYIRDGIITHRFYPGKINFDIKPLPTYLPGNIPVGVLKLTLRQQPGLVLKNRLASMHLLLIGDGIPQAWLPDIRHVFKSSQQRMFYPVEKTSQQTTAAGILSQHAYQIPFKSLTQGSLTLPRIRLHYFDPVIGKLVSISLQQASSFSMALWLLILLLIMTAALSLMAVSILYRRFIPLWLCLRTYHRAVHSLPALQTPQQFKALTRQLSLGEGWPGNLSLRQWMTRSSTTQAGQICLQLETALYGGEACDLQTLQTTFKQLCLLRWPILGWIRPI